MGIRWLVAALAIVFLPIAAWAQDVNDIAPDELPYAGETAGEAWVAYREARGAKAFALAQDRAWGRSFGEGVTLAEARLNAPERCRGESRFECFVFAENNTVVWTNPGLAALDVLPYVDEKTRGIFRDKFLRATFNRAFAISADGAFGGGWHSNRSMKDMRKAALDSCRGKPNYRSRNPCVLFMENDTVVYQE